MHNIVPLLQQAQHQRHVGCACGVQCGNTQRPACQPSSLSPRAGSMPDTAPPASAAALPAALCCAALCRLMGRAASHITLECALQTHPQIALVSEEIAANKLSLHDLAVLVRGFLWSAGVWGAGWLCCPVCHKVSFDGRTHSCTLACWSTQDQSPNPMATPPPPTPDPPAGGRHGGEAARGRQELRRDPHPRGPHRAGVRHEGADRG